MTLINPVPGGWFTDGFGPRGNVKGLGDLGFHTGQDIAAPTGTPILAAHAGTVSRKWWDAYANGAGAGGWMVAIRGDDGYESRYAHMQSQSPLPVGQRVIGGQTVIGHVGSSGAATGAHLHLEAIRDGQYIDPLPLMGGTETGDDDMSAKAEAQIDAIWQGIFGPANAGGQQMNWASVDGPRTAAYGVLDIDIHTQSLVAQMLAEMRGQNAALVEAIKQLSKGGGQIDMTAITKAAEKGAKDALAGLTLKAEAKG